MERGVEDGDMRHVRQRAPRVVDASQRRRVVQRREWDERLDLGENVVVDDDRLTKARAAVHDTMRDGVDVLRERIDRLRALAFDDVKLEARRAGVDDQESNGQTQSRTSG